MCHRSTRARSFPHNQIWASYFKTEAGVSTNAAVLSWHALKREKGWLLLLTCSFFCSLMRTSARSEHACRLNSCYQQAQQQLACQPPRCSVTEITSSFTTNTNFESFTFFPPRKGNNLKVPQHPSCMRWIHDTHLKHHSRKGVLKRGKFHTERLPLMWTIFQPPLMEPLPLKLWMKKEIFFWDAAWFGHVGYDNVGQYSSAQSHGWKSWRRSVNASRWRLHSDPIDDLSDKNTTISSAEPSIHGSPPSHRLLFSPVSFWVAKKSRGSHVLFYVHIALDNYEKCHFCSK